jgi:AcrR family transcriptional regulator
MARADARRNRELVLQAAKEVFADHGPGASLDEIARRAGVGPGTVHRHFPAKAQLYEEVLGQHLDEMTAAAQRAQAHTDTDTDTDTGESFYALLNAIIAESHSKRDLADALSATGATLSPQTFEKVTRLRSQFEQLLDTAQRSGTVRTDIEPADVYDIVLAATSVRDRASGDPARAERTATVMLDCLRPQNKASGDTHR